MGRGIVAGNWKMHGSRRFVSDYVDGLAGAMDALNAAGRAVEGRLILFPPVGYLALLAEKLVAAGLAETVRSELGA